MSDLIKFKILMVLATALTVLIITHNIASELFLSEIESYLQRRSYFENVIEKKKLPMHKGMHWREKE
ncbi:MAG: hypothetical protein HZA17_14155 [Nitrospirae bacterium]|nr:hypothetical protein [Nitrospirota bacterium]